MDRALRLGVLVSGRGSNLQAILDAVARGSLNVEVALVACNRPGAGAVARAERAGVPVELFSQSEYGSREAQQRAIADRLEAEGVDLVVCAGWDRIFTAEFVRRFPGRIINVHPSLLPAFGGGLHAVRDALAYGVKITGCTVHFVTDELDAGPVISQAAVAVLPDDTEETLAERIHVEEHRLLVEAVGLYAQGRLGVEGRTVRVKGDDN
ncbi:MAG TPA: phosphoribosylglycinamide formyltransferase [Chloroflexia bacterium]|nr:phosphoribosylglycinamide formyltransferase [Chloroflexia bacterium]